MGYYYYYYSTPRHCWMIVDRICIIYISKMCIIIGFQNHWMPFSFWQSFIYVVVVVGCPGRGIVYTLLLYVHANIIMRYASVDVTPESYLPLFYHFICLCVCIWFYLAWLGSFFSPPAFQLLFFFNSPNKERNSIFYSMPAL